MQRFVERLKLLRLSLMLRLSRFLLLVLLQTGPTHAQAVQDIALGHIPADLRARALADCGVSIGLDRTWPVAITREKDNRERQVTTHQVDLFTSYWREHWGVKLPIVNPTMVLWVQCKPSILSDAGTRDWAQRRRDGKDKERRVTASEVRTVSRRGLGDVHYFTHSERSGRKVTDTMEFFLKRGQTSVIGYVFIPRTPDRAYRTEVPAGTVVPEHSAHPAFRVMRPALKDRNGVVHMVRSAEENQTLMLDILSSLRAN